MARLVLLLALFGCAGLPAVPDAPPDPRVRPGALFGGATCGAGVLTHADGTTPRPFTVESRGAPAGEGLILDQTIRFDDGEVRERRWTLQPDGARTYRGTLTEASGDVRAQVGGNRLTLSYPLAGVPLGRMTQVLTLRADGGVDNVGTARVAGVPVRRLREEIARAGEEGCPPPHTNTLP